jgi:hypothetical protein
MRLGFVHGYMLDSGIGKKVANLKGLDTGWSYPTFLVQFVRNPGPLLLFDKIVIDEEAANQAVNCFMHPNLDPSSYEGCVIRTARPTKKEASVLKGLLESDLFIKKDISNMLTEDDYLEIGSGYYADTGLRGERNEHTGFRPKSDSVKTIYNLRKLLLLFGFSRA